MDSTQTLVAVIACLAISLRVTQADTVYRTEFENFTVGPQAWVGTEGWIGYQSSTGSQGIDQDAIPGSGLGKTAFIGFSPPTGTTNSVLAAKPVNLNPATNSESIIEFETLLGIKDSTNNFRDEFWISFYNITPGTRLAAVRFQNGAFSSLIYRSDGTSSTNTGVSFIPGELHQLFVRLDLEKNRWSAFLDDIPLFNGAVFTNLSATRTLGSVGVEWRRPAGVSTWGNNWMLIADWTVRTMPHRIDAFFRNPNGSMTLKWTGDPGRAYQVQHSPDMKTWFSNLSGSTYAAQPLLGTLTFTDSISLPEKRFYRVTRAP
jgi:hypothetical protein